jgi:hypothetical protein
VTCRKKMELWGELRNEWPTISLSHLISMSSWHKKWKQHWGEYLSTSRGLSFFCFWKENEPFSWGACAISTEAQLNKLRGFPNSGKLGVSVCDFESSGDLVFWMRNWSIVLASVQSSEKWVKDHLQRSRWLVQPSWRFPIAATECGLDSTISTRYDSPVKRRNGIWDIGLSSSCK